MTKKKAEEEKSEFEGFKGEYLEELSGMLKKSMGEALDVAYNYGFDAGIAEKQKELDAYKEEVQKWRDKAAIILEGMPEKKKKEEG